MNYMYVKNHGIRQTIISFEPFLRREDVCHLSDHQIAEKFGLSTDTVKGMRNHHEVPFDTIQRLCHALECQPGDIMDAKTAYYLPAKKSPDA